MQDQVMYNIAFFYKSALDRLYAIAYRFYMNILKIIIYI